MKGKQKPSKQPKKPRKPYVALLAVLVLVCSTWNIAMASSEKAGLNAFGGFYAIGSPDVHFNQRQAFEGVSWAHFWKSNLSSEIDFARPRETAGEYAGNGDVAFHKGPLFIPVGITYVQQDPGLKVNGGAGINFWASKLNLSFKALYLYDLTHKDDPADRGTWQAAGAVRVGF